MTMIDNGLGMGMMRAPSVKGEYDKDAVVELNDNKLFGASPSPDCPQDGKGGYCDKLSRCGLLSSMFVRGGASMHPQSPSGKPYYKSMAFGQWSGSVILNRNKFINWLPRTQTGAKQFVLCINPSGSDTIQPHMFYDTELDNVHPEAMAWIMTPP